MNICLCNIGNGGGGGYEAHGCTPWSGQTKDDKIGNSCT